MIALGYALALLIGLSLGLLGGGGSILTIPVLHYVMGYPVEQAIPMSLVVVGFTSAVGALAHWRGGTLNLRVVLSFGPAAMLGALLGAELGLRASAELRLQVFALVLLAAGLSMLFGAQLVRAAEPEQQRHPLVLVFVIGGLVGTLTGFVGVGGGFLYVPALVLLGGLPMKQAVGSSLALILLSCATAVARYHGSQQLDWPAIALFTAVALIGVALGSRLVRYVSQAMLRRGFAVFVLLIGAWVLLRGL